MDERAFRAVAGEPLREQLWRCAAPAQRDPRTPCGARLGARAGVRDQRPQARRGDGRGLGDPARGLFRFAWRAGRRSAHWARGAARWTGGRAGARLWQRRGLASQFTAMAKALAGGSGWVILAWSERFGRLINHWAADHAHNLPGASPILALDMYEHAYHLDFGAKAAAYVDQVMANLNWERIGA